MSYPLIDSQIAIRHAELLCEMHPGTEVKLRDIAQEFCVGYATIDGVNVVGKAFENGSSVVITTLLI